MGHKLRFKNINIKRKAIHFRSKSIYFIKLFLYRLIKSSLFTNKILEHYLKFRRCPPIVVVGIPIRITISIAIVRGIWPIIVATKIIPIGIIIKVVALNKINIYIFFLSNQRG